MRLFSLPASFRVITLTLTAAFAVLWAATPSSILAASPKVEASSPASDAAPTTITFSLEDPLITKADWESALLRTGDFNGDGLIDFLTVNNQKSALQVFYQKKPTAKDAPRVFEKKDIVMDNEIAGIAVGDFNGDGRTDLVIAPNNKNIFFRFQQADGTFGPGVPVEAQAGALQATDLDGDGLTDVVGLAQDKTFIIYGSKNANASENTDPLKPVMFFNGVVPGSYPLLGDYDGNGLADILYLDSARHSRILVALQTAPRDWDLQSSYELSDADDIAVIKSEPRKPAGVAIVHSGTKEIRLYRLDPSAPNVEKFPLQSPHYLSIDPKLQSERESILATDLDGNGRQDLLIASPEAAELTLYMQSDKGRLAMRSAASLSGVTSIAAIPRKKGGSLIFALSAEREEAIGVSQWDAARGLSVPEFLSTPQKPLVMTTADLDGSGKLDLLYLFKVEKEGLKLAEFLNPVDTGVFRQKPNIVPVPASADEEPVALMAADLNGDKRADLLLFGKYSPLRIFIQKPDGTFAPFTADQTVTKGVFNKVSPGQVTLADLNGDGSQELLVSRESFVRAYGIDKSGSLRPMEQFNGKNASANIETAVAADLDGSGKPVVILLDSGNKCLTIYARDKAGAFALTRSQSIEGIRATRLLSVDANGDGKQDLLAYGGDAVQLFYAGQDPARFKPVWSHEPEDRDWKYSKVTGARLLGGDSGPADQLLALEGTQHVLEFYAIDKKSPDTPRRFYHFKVFDDDQSMGRQQENASPEPRSLVAVDIDGDGKNDLLALVHDNVLYYRQK